MELLTHRGIPAAQLRPLRSAVTQVEKARVKFDEAFAAFTAAKKQVPAEDQMPADAGKQESWRRKRDQRLENLGIEEEALAAAVETLDTANGALKLAVEGFREFTAELFDDERLLEAARRATCNVLMADRLWAQTDDVVSAERARTEVSWLDKVLLKQRFLANQRHYTVRLRIDSAHWSYVQDRAGKVGASGVIPSVPCLTFGEAEHRCTELGRGLDKKTSGMAFEVQVYDLVNRRSCGTSVVRSLGLMPRAES